MPKPLGTADLVIMESEFFQACWEAADCSILEHPTLGRQQLFCHFSSRLIALCDTEEMAEVLLLRARLAAIRNRRRGPDPAFEQSMDEWFAPQVGEMTETLAELGVPDAEGAPEIAGSDARMAATPEAATVRSLLTGTLSVSIAFAGNCQAPGWPGSLSLEGPLCIEHDPDELMVDGPPEWTAGELAALLPRFFSDLVLHDEEGESSARLRLSEHLVAHLELRCRSGGRWLLSVSRHPASR